MKIIREIILPKPKYCDTSHTCPFCKKNYYQGKTNRTCLLGYFNMHDVELEEITTNADGTKYYRIVRPEKCIEQNGE